MYGVEAERGNARQVLVRARWGYRLLGAYLVGSIAAEVLLAVAARGAWTAVTEVVLGTGGALLVGVTLANRRARARLATTRPDLTKVVASKSFQPGSGGAGCLYLLALSLVGAVGVVLVVVAGAAAATATTQVTVDSCNNGGRGQEALCAAHWRAEGRDFSGNISWVSSVQAGGTAAGKYDPAHPDIVYEAGAPYLNGETVMAGVYLLVMLPLTALLFRKYLRDCRHTYLANLTGATAG